MTVWAGYNLPLLVQPKHLLRHTVTTPLTLNYIRRVNGRFNNLGRQIGVMLLLLAPSWPYVMLCTISYARYGHRPYAFEPLRGDYNYRIWQDVTVYLFFVSWAATVVCIMFLLVRREHPRRWTWLMILLVAGGANLLLYGIDPLDARRWLITDRW